MDELNQKPSIPTSQTLGKSHGSKMMLFIFGAVIILIGVGAYLLGVNKAQAPVANNVIPQSSPTIADETANPDSIGANWKTYKSSLIGIELKLPLTWIATEKDENVNDYLSIKDATSNSELTIFKNYIGGVAGFKTYGEDIEFKIAGIETNKIYVTEETESQNISAFINLMYNQNKYLIIGKWEINDLTTEKTIDQILSTFQFTD